MAEAKLTLDSALDNRLDKTTADYVRLAARDILEIVKPGSNRLLHAQSLELVSKIIRKRLGQVR